MIILLIIIKTPNYIDIDSLLQRMLKEQLKQSSSINAKCDQHVLIKTKQKLHDKYFMQSQKQFDQDFISSIFDLAQHDKQINELLKRNINKILYSKQNIAISFLSHLLKHRQYSIYAHSFLVKIIRLEITLSNQRLLIHILKELPKIILMLIANKYYLYEALIVFLALQMRSFNFQIRLHSIESLYNLTRGFPQEYNRQWQQTFRNTLPKMIERQKLVKEVSYTKGLFLQMLQDQRYQIRTRCLKCLILFKNYFKQEDLKQIIIYMLNDEHELVREESLKSIKFLNSINLSKQDLQTLLMCLRQKRTIMRRQTYQSLSIASINDTSLLSILIQKMLVALQTYKSDKKHIYKAFLKIGCKYQSYIQKLMSFLGLNQTEEPNFKNILYKAKMILCYNWWKQKSSQKHAEFPKYFVKHMLYICDVQSYLFQNSNSRIQQQIESSVDFDKLSSNTHYLIKFIQCQSQISQQFHKVLFDLLKSYTIGHQVRLLLKSLQKLIILYKLGKQEYELLGRIKTMLMIQQINKTNILQLAKECIRNRQKFEFQDMSVPFNKCTVSRLQPNLLVSSKQKTFIDNVYLKCLKHKILGKERRTVFILLRSLQIASQIEESYFWHVNLSKYSEIECVLKIAGFQQQNILDSFDIDQR